MTTVENPEVMYLNAKLYVKPENQKEFVALSPLYSEVIFENYGYQLVHASYPITGDVHAFNHIWRIPKDAPLAGVMIATAREAERESVREAKLASVDAMLDEVRTKLNEPATGPLSSSFDKVRRTLGASRGPRPARPGAPPLRLTMVEERKKALHDEYGRFSASGECLCQVLGHDTCLLVEVPATTKSPEQGGAPHGARERVTGARAATAGAPRRSAAERADAADALAALAVKLAFNAAEEVAKDGPEREALVRFYLGAAEKVAEEARENRPVAGVANPFTRIQEMIERTEQNLMTALPYDPNYFGFQSQSILVDTEGELWLLEHERLRSSKKSLDSAPGDQYLATEAELRGLLQQGATVAVVREEDSSRALLFNLAGLQPKSVFQHRPAPTDGIASQSGFRLPSGDSRADFPGNVSALYVATTWGDIYRLTGKDIEELASPLHGATVGDTPKLIQRLVDARVPLAAVPEVRDQPVGWGYYCYVINLSSFASGQRHVSPGSVAPALSK